MERLFENTPEPMLPEEITDDERREQRVDALLDELAQELRWRHPRFRIGAEPMPQDFWRGYIESRLPDAHEAAARKRWHVQRVRLLEIAAAAIAGIDHLDRGEIAEAAAEAAVAKPRARAAAEG